MGTPGRDTIRGTARNDVIAGLGGHDVILGGGGNDTICGGPGNDRITGNAGHDKLIGQGGRDRLFGGAGVDRLFGGLANDFLAGQTGPDVLRGGPGSDTLDGGIGVDLCAQGTGAGPMVRCELPKSVFAPPAPPAPATGKLVVGGSGSGQIGFGGFRWYEGRDRGPWQTWDECLTGLTPDYEWDWEDRFAMEFPLWGLPAGASVTRATLAIRTSLAPTATHAIYGYAGNGYVEPADMVVGGTPVTFSARTSDARTSSNVTSLLTPAVLGSGWAGFSVRNEPLGFPSEEWACTPVSVMYPILTIEYTVP